MGCCVCVVCVVYVSGDCGRGCVDDCVVVGG